MKLRIDGRLIWDTATEQSIGLPKADHIAQANGFVYVEHMVKAWAGHVIEVDDTTFKVTSPVEVCFPCEGKGQAKAGGQCANCGGSGKVILVEAHP